MKQINIFTKYNPVQAIELMIAALEHFKNSNKLRLDMDSFGRYSEDSETCYGCLATCSIFYVTGEEPTKNNIEWTKHPVNGYTEDSVSSFENAIDDFRIGDVETFLLHWVPDYFDSEMNEGLDQYKGLLEIDLSEFSYRSASLHLDGDYESIDEETIKDFIKEATSIKDKINKKLGHLWN